MQKVFYFFSFPAWKIFELLATGKMWNFCLLIISHCCASTEETDDLDEKHGKTTNSCVAFLMLKEDIIYLRPRQERCSEICLEYI